MRDPAIRFEQSPATLLLTRCAWAQAAALHEFCLLSCRANEPGLIPRIWTVERIGTLARGVADWGQLPVDGVGDTQNDPYGIASFAATMLGIGVPSLFAAIDTTKDDSLELDIASYAAETMVKAGLWRLATHQLESFAALDDPSVASPGLAAAIALLQFFAGADHTELLFNEMGTDKAELYWLLVVAIDKGAAAPLSLAGSHSAHDKAASALTMLFGREESDGVQEGSLPVTVPPETTRSQVQLAHAMIAGTHSGIAVMQMKALLALSVSDGNTAAMVEAGVLKTIALALSMGHDEIGARLESYRYKIPAVRSVRVLVRTPLSGHSDGG